MHKSSMVHDTYVVVAPCHSAILMLIGVYLVACGIGGMLVPDRWHRIIDELNASPTLTLYGGIIALLLGAGIASVTAGSWVVWLGLASMLKGVVLLIAPPGIFAFYRRILTPTNGRIISVLLLIFGIALIALPFFNFLP